MRFLCLPFSPAVRFLWLPFSPSGLSFKTSASLLVHKDEWKGGGGVKEREDESTRDRLEREGEEERERQTELKVLLNKVFLVIL